ncbi:MAG: hypothetical protein ACE37F_02150 [Nannocystaceae bacterium]|nr:hypothetical protein [bacterium]
MPSEKKSVLVSGLVSFFFGPLGWFYAGPMKSALIGGGAWLLTAMVLPKFMLVYLASVVGPVSAIAGILYAFGFNRTGERIPLFGGDDQKKLSA